MAEVWQLETGRAWLRPWSAGDDVAFRRLTQDARVMRYISNGQPWSEQQTHEFIERQRAGFATRGYCLWKLVAKETGELAGMCGLQPLANTPDIEIGWWLAPEYWGQGLATEAARCVLGCGFTKFRLDEIVAVALRENRASLRVMEKLGMRDTGNITHRGFEVARYAITRAEYERAARSANASK